MVGSAAAGATLLLPGGIAAAAGGKKTFTILHTNDLHSNLIGMAPASDYSPFKLNDDTDQGRVRTSGHVDREEESGARRSRACVGA